MKLVVIGGVAGGASAACRVRRLDAKAEIIIFERGEHVSFSNCCLPYHLGGVVKNSDSLVLMSPERFETEHDIRVRTLSEVTSINRAEKTVTVKNLQDGTTYQESYDKLVLAPGASPIRPKSIPGIGNKNVYTIRNVSDIRKLKACLDRPEVRNVAVVGGGFIGLEACENIVRAGKKVSLIEGLDQVMTPMDYDMVQILHKELLDNGVDVHLSSMLCAVGEKSVTVKQHVAENKISATAEGNGAVDEAGKVSSELEIPADAVVLCIGVAPETKLAVSAGLEIGETGAIAVNHNYQTADPDIYAVGDAVELTNALTHKKGKLALAGPAQREARAAADSMYRIPHNNNGFIGSSCLRLFGQNAACTGLNEKAAAKAGFHYDYVTIFPNDKVSLMPESHYMAFKLIFEVPTGKILGAQAIGKGDVTKRIDVIAAMITMHGTLENLKELELCYSPVFDTAKDVVNLAALVGLNVLYGRYRQVHVNEVRGLVESGACIIDVRNPAEYDRGHLKGAKNIPLKELRSRMDEIPKDVPVYVHCRSSQRSYYALCALQGNGYDNIVNISGSFLGISLYEYFDDVTMGREPIVTAYNFN